MMKSVRDILVTSMAATCTGDPSPNTSNETYAIPLVNRDKI